MEKDYTDDNKKPSIACYRKLIVMLFISGHSSGSQSKISIWPRMVYLTMRS